MTPEKDNEGQSEYYLSYPKPLVFNTKWVNHDINVVELANIPKFSPLLTKWRLRENVLRPMERLTPTVEFEIFITISYLLVCQPIFELTTFEQQVCSTTQMRYHWEQAAAKKECGHFEQRTSSKKAV